MNQEIPVIEMDEIIVKDDIADKVKPEIDLNFDTAGKNLW